MAKQNYKTKSSGYVGTTWKKYVCEKRSFITNSTPKSDADRRPRYLLAETDTDVPPANEDGTPMVGTPMLPMTDNLFEEGQIVWVRSGVGESLITHIEEFTKE